MQMVDQYTSGNLIPWPLPQNVDDSHKWRHLSDKERMKVIRESVLDWAHEEWMQVID